MGKSTITWSPRLVLVKDVKPTPNNYKIKTDLGKERLQKSLQLFGLAGTVVCNTDLSLIDGNSRLQEAKERGEKKIYVSVPNRKLTPTEYREMAAMYDFAKAGEVDMDRIEQDLGTKEDFFKKWNLQVPTRLLEAMGKKASKTVLEQSKKRSKAAEEGEAVNFDAPKTLTVFFNSGKELEQFRQWEDKLAAKFKTDNTSDTVIRAMRYVVHGK